MSINKFIPFVAIAVGLLCVCVVQSGSNSGWSAGWDAGAEFRGKYLPEIQSGGEYGLYGINKIRVLVSDYSINKNNDEFSKVAKSLIESRLRLVGIEVADEFGENDFNVGTIVFDYSVNDWGNGRKMHRSQIYFGRNVLFYNIKEDGSVDFTEGLVASWNYHAGEKINVSNSANREIREHISEEMDVFTNQWLKENAPIAVKEEG